MPFGPMRISPPVVRMFRHPFQVGPRSNPNIHFQQTDTMKRKLTTLTLILFSSAMLMAQTENLQRFELNAKKAGKIFDGIGMVNGGGGTSALLKDYPEPQRSEILDLVFKPMHGASVSTMLVEIPGDGNSTQGSMPSHMHTRDDLNYQRGYTWWVLSEAMARNPQLGDERGEAEKQGTCPRRSGVERTRMGGRRKFLEPGCSRLLCVMVEGAEKQLWSEDDCHGMQE